MSASNLLQDSAISETPLLQDSRFCLGIKFTQKRQPKGVCVNLELSQSISWNWFAHCVERAKRGVQQTGFRARQVSNYPIMRKFSGLDFLRAIKFFAQIGPFFIALLLHGVRFGIHSGKYFSLRHRGSQRDGLGSFDAARQRSKEFTSADASHFANQSRRRFGDRRARP